MSLDSSCRYFSKGISDIITRASICIQALFSLSSVFNLIFCDSFYNFREFHATRESQISFWILSPVLVFKIFYELYYFFLKKINLAKIEKKLNFLAVAWSVCMKTKMLGNENPSLKKKKKKKKWKK